MDLGNADRSAACACIMDENSRQHVKMVKIVGSKQILVVFLKNFLMFIETTPLSYSIIGISVIPNNIYHNNEIVQKQVKNRIK